MGECYGLLRTTLDVIFSYKQQYGFNNECPNQEHVEFNVTKPVVTLDAYVQEKAEWA